MVTFVNGNNAYVQDAKLTAEKASELVRSITKKLNVTNTRNWLHHNLQNSLFACYASGQDDVCLYQ